MNFFQIEPVSQFKITVDIPGSKSITNRALILSALSHNKVILTNVLFSDDTNFMIDALKVLGNNINVDRFNKKIEIIGNSNLIFNNIKIYIGNAGTAIRFLASYLATGIGTATLYGNKRMNERPIKSLIDSLIQLGVKVQYLKKYGYPPIKITSTGITSNYVEIDGSDSSQYISSILMIAPKLQNPITLKLIGTPVSKPYIEMTLHMMKTFGVNVQILNNTIQIIPKNYKCHKYNIEGDMSSASYFLAMALIGNSTVTLNNFNKNSIQGDYKFLSILMKMGLKLISSSDNSVTVQGVSRYNGISLDMNDIPDVAQTLAITALFAQTPTKVWNIKNLRIKETDRLIALKNELSKINANFNEFDDGFLIIPKSENQYIGNFLNTYDDHRMAMSLSLLGLRVKNIKILNPNCVSKTFPTYFEEFKKIYKGVI